jgi:hypothetical protein
MLKAYLHPKKKPNDRHWYAYDVVFDGEIIVTDSRDPEHDLARALLARGIKCNVTLHDGPTRKPRAGQRREGRALVRWQQPRKVQVEGP